MGSLRFEPSAARSIVLRRRTPNSKRGGVFAAPSSRSQPVFRVRDLGLALILDTSGWATVRSAQHRPLQHSARAGIPFVTGAGPHGPRNATAATTPKKCQIVDIRFIKSFLVSNEDFHIKKSYYSHDARFCKLKCAPRS